MTLNIQIDDVVRLATADEAEIIEAHQADFARLEAQIAAKFAARQSAAAKLAALGLTDDEIKAMVG